MKIELLKALKEKLFEQKSITNVDAEIIDNAIEELENKDELEDYVQDITIRYNKLCQEKIKWLKQAKALEIIKAKKVDTELIKSSEDYFEYQTSTYRTKVTGEEFDLLKEVFYDKKF